MARALEPKMTYAERVLRYHARREQWISTAYAMTRAIVLVLMCFLSFHASGAIYQCKSAEGKVVFQQMPCASGEQKAMDNKAREQAKEQARKQEEEKLRRQQKGQ